MNVFRIQFVYQCRGWCPHQPQASGPRNFLCAIVGVFAANTFLGKNTGMNLQLFSPAKEKTG